MKPLPFHPRYTLFIQILFFSTLLITSAIANTDKYLCRGENNNIFLKFEDNKQVIIGDNNPKKYWTKPNFRFWHSAKDYSVYEYSFNYSFNKLSGKLEVKSHNLVTSEDKWYYYTCKIN